jgi:hypothetical protein
LTLNPVTPLSSPLKSPFLNAYKLFVFFMFFSLPLEKNDLDQTHLFSNLNLELVQVQVQVQGFFDEKFESRRVSILVLACFLE